ncbi:Ankyrin repeats (3 copies) [Popillia japonica]|uniref:Ankyrin repeats (3 copies) n=1 Tax=Popillia japonica TaxID=7064 RepID=A0AAW1NF33_POPJA
MAAQNSVYESAHKGDYDFVKNEIDANPELVFKADNNERLLLHWAALSGNVKLVEYLLERKSPVDIGDDNDSTPLILAASAGRKGANVNHTTSQGHSSLQYACSKAWDEIVQLLLDNSADINIADVRGATPLHRAASKGNLTTVKILLKYKDKLKIDNRDIYGNTALHLACEEDRTDEAKLLIEHGASLDVRNLDKNTPLDLCSRGEKLTVL